MKARSVSHADEEVSSSASERILNGLDGSQITEDAYAPGKVIAGKYRVDRVLGEGAMGIVLAATHLELDERVAIKFIRPEMQKAQGVVARFAREAKASRRINSEHTANVLDVGVTKTIGPYIVMEYLEGKDLADLLVERGPLPIRRAAEYVLQACEALALAHVNNITHRDIKPENLFVIRRGELEIVKVLDFGISKVALTGRVFGDELSTVETSCLMGTPLYMSPEQIRATSNVDQRTDIWSLGAVFYELVTGRTAFVADSVTQVCAMVLETEPPPLADFCPQATPELQAVIDRCMQKDPDKRFQTVAEFAVALLPFAPSRARMHAERSTSILRGSGIDVSAERPSSMPAPGMLVGPVTIPGGAKLPTQPSMTLHSDATPESSTRPVVGSSTLPRIDEPTPKKSRLGWVVAALAVAASGGYFAFTQNAAPVAPAAANAPAPVAQPAPVAPATATPGGDAQSGFRTVLVDSQPTDAEVEIGGKALGRTPVKATLPVGPIILSVSKTGFNDAALSFNVEAAQAGAQPMRQLVLLERADPKRPSLRARPVARAGVRGVPAAPAEDASQKNAPAPVESRPASKETKPRARLGLVEEQSRAKLLD